MDRRGNKSHNDTIPYPARQSLLTRVRFFLKPVTAQSFDASVVCVNFCTSQRQMKCYRNQSFLSVATSWKKGSYGDGWPETITTTTLLALYVLL